MLAAHTLRTSPSLVNGHRSCHQTSVGLHGNSGLLSTNPCHQAGSKCSIHPIPSLQIWTVTLQAWISWPTFRIQADSCSSGPSAPHWPPPCHLSCWFFQALSCSKMSYLEGSQSALFPQHPQRMLSSIEKGEKIGRSSHSALPSLCTANT